MAMLRLLVLATACAPLHAASALPERHALFASLPSPKNRPAPASWLLAATGKCTHQQYTELEGDAGSPYIANVKFTFMPSTTLQFTDAPYRQAFEIVSPDDQVNELADVEWSYKNVALLEPDADGTDWAISTFEIDEHGISEGSDAVLYSGRVTARSASFPGVRTDTFPCQLFVDASVHEFGTHGGWCEMKEYQGFDSEFDENVYMAVACEEGRDDCYCCAVDDPYWGCEEGGLVCRSHGTGDGWRSMCCKCNEQMIGGKCVDCGGGRPGCESTC